MAVISGDKAGKEICGALGIDYKHVFSLDIRFAVGEVATVTVGRYIDDGKLNKLTKVLKQYKLESETGVTP